MTAEPGRRGEFDDREKTSSREDRQPAAKGRLDQRLGVRLLDLGEYVEVLVEAPDRQTMSSLHIANFD